MPSAAGKRVGRVLAGCSKPEARDKPGLHTWQGILGSSRYSSMINNNVRFGDTSYKRGVSITYMTTIDIGFDGIYMKKVTLRQKVRTREFR